jgi:aryl-alcohol dehydrogenase-like predicted oxidoreductase
LLDAHTSSHPLGACQYTLKEVISAGITFFDSADIYPMGARWDAPRRSSDAATLDAIVTAGEARYIGVSNFVAYRLARAAGRTETLHLTRIASVQPRYNLLFRQIERELLALAAETGMAGRPEVRRPVQRTLLA